MSSSTYQSNISRALASRPSQRRLGNIHEFVNVGNSALQQRRRRLQTRHPEYGSKQCRRRSATSYIVITKSMNSTNKWIGRVVIGEIIRCWIKELLLSSKKRCVFRDSVLCLGGKCQEQQDLGKRSHQRIRPKPRIQTTQRHHRKTRGSRVEYLRGKHDDRNPLLHQKYVGKTRNTTVSVSGQYYVHVRVQ